MNHYLTKYIQKRHKLFLKPLFFFLNITAQIPNVMRNSTCSDLANCYLVHKIFHLL